MLNSAKGPAVQSLRAQGDKIAYPREMLNVLEAEKSLEIKDLVYKPTPSFEFYDSYKKVLNEMKKNVHKSLYPDNAAFTGFLRIVMED